MPFKGRYQPEQREAAAVAVLDRGMKSERVAALAKEGLLELDGSRVTAFEIEPQYVRTLATRERDRRASRALKTAASMNPTDSIERLRRQLHETAHRKVARLKKRDPDKVTATELREMAAAVTAISRIPLPNQPEPKPNPRENPSPASKVTQGQRAGALMQAMRSNGTETPAQEHDLSGSRTQAPSEQLA